MHGFSARNLDGRLAFAEARAKNALLQPPAAKAAVGNVTLPERQSTGQTSLPSGAPGPLPPAICHCLAAASMTARSSSRWT